jgi:hypothetical protein
MVAAAAAAQVAALSEAIDVLHARSPVTTMVQLLRWVGDPNPQVRRAVVRASAAVLRHADTRSLWAVDRALRGGSPWLFEGVAPKQLAALAAGPDGIGGVALLSMQRNGFTRELAVCWLRGSKDPLALRLLLLRANDPVVQVREAAEAQLHAAIRSCPATLLVEALPLIDAMQQTVRAGRSRLHAAVDARLAIESAPVRDALWRSAERGSDDDVRRLALLRLARGPELDVVRALRTGLGDRSPRVRHAIAQRLRDTSLSGAVIAAVLPAMDANPSPTVRELAVHLRRDDDSPEARRQLLAHSFDHHAGVRFRARCRLRELGEQIDMRAAALGRLADPDCARGAIVGALAVLSDLGRYADIPAVARFVGGSTRRVAQEATRTLEILQAGPPD